MRDPLAIFVSSLFACALLMLTPCPRARAQLSTAGDREPSAVVARAPSPHDAAMARRAYLAGAKLLETNHLPDAKAAFDHAAAIDPTVVDYRIASSLALEHSVTALVQRAGEARLQGRDSDAAHLLAEARALDPSNSVVLQHDDPLPSRPGFQSVLELSRSDPQSGHPSGQAGPYRAAGRGGGADDLAADLFPDSAAGLGGPIRLTPNATRHSFHLHTDLRSAVAEVFTSFGLRATFDDSVVPSATPQGIRFDLDNTTAGEAIPVLLSMGRLFATPLESTSALLAADTPANRTRLEHLYQETLYTPGLNPQQMGELANVIRQVFDVKQLSMLNTSGTITLRAPASTLDALNRTLVDLVDGTTEVMLDLRLYSVDTTRQRNIGPTVPQQFGVYNVASAAQSIVSANQSAIDQAIAQGVLTFPAGANAATRLVIEALFLIQSGLAQSSLLTNTLGFFGGGITLSGATIAGGAGFQLSLNSSDSRTLDYIQLRASDRQLTTFRSGTRYPIVTSTYSTGLAGTNSAALAGATINGVSVASLLNQFLGSGSAGTTIPQIQYEDLGITLKATPNVQSSGNITLHLDLKIEALAGAALNNIPLLASRQIASDVTVGEGQTALLVSSLSKTEAVAVNGIPGLSELPGFGNTTADNLRQRDTSDLVILITPHLTRRRANLTVGPRIPVSSSTDSAE